MMKMKGRGEDRSLFYDLIPQTGLKIYKRMRNTMFNEVDLDRFWCVV